MSKQSKKLVRRWLHRQKTAESDHWYRNRYDIPKQDPTNENLPTGLDSGIAGLTYINPYPDEGDKPDLPVDRHRNEIEWALFESDLPREERQHAMSLLPNMREFYDFLRQQGAHKTTLLIRRVLNFN